MLENRVKIHEIEPDAMSAMLGLEGYIKETELEPSLKQIIKIRASQLNGCAYCIEMHTNEARKVGVSQQKMHAIAAWKESPLFSDIERGVLLLTESLTLNVSDGLEKEVYEEVLNLLGKQQLVQCIMQVVIINAWNRIAVATKMRH